MNTCSYEFGRGILRARSLMSLVSEQSQDDEIICFNENLHGSNFEQRTNSNIEFKIYPNPFTDEFNYSFSRLSDKYLIQIKDLQGKLFQTFNLINRSGTVNTSGLPIGVYFMVLSDGKDTKIQKLMKL